MKSIILTFLFLLLKFTLINTSYILIDKLLDQIEIDFPNCFGQNIQFEEYRGTITNFDNIEDTIIKNNYELPENITHSLIYFDNKQKLLKYIDYIPDSTLIFAPFSIEYNEMKRFICVVKMEKWSSYHYIFISEKKLTYITLPLIFCWLYITAMVPVYKEYKKTLRILAAYRNIYFYRVVRYLIFLSIGITITTITIYYFLLSYIFYSIYKSYLIINLILLLEGFSIIHFNDSEKKFKKYILIFFLFDFLTALISEYIVYFFPFIDNFYIFHLKSMIEHITLLIVIFVFFHKKFIHLYKQYLLEKRLRTIFSRTYKIKTIIYVKIMIFSIIYCSAFIILPFIEKIYLEIDSCVETFYINYFITIFLELFFNVILSIILYPQDLSLYFFLPTIFDYNTFKFKVTIKQNIKNKLNISNLSHDLLKNEYVEKEYPLIFITPYAKTDKVFDNIKVGSLGKS